MSNLTIRKAVKGKQKLRLGLIGPTGSGKTWTALLFAEELVRGTSLRIGVIDSERESSELYADRFDFDVIQLTESHDPREYVAALKAFADAGNYGCVIVDSLSHAWMGRDGALEQVDKAAAHSRSNNKFVAWGAVTPLQNQMVDALLAVPYHLITTLRAKMEYVQEKDEKGNTSVRKLGLQPVQRDGMEYEFTVVCDIDTDHKLIVGKTRCNLVDGKVVDRPGADFARVLRDWIESGADQPEKQPASPELRQQIRDMAGRRLLKPGERDALEKALANGLTQGKAQDTITWLESKPNMTPETESA